MLDETVKRSVPITLGALSGVLCERVAVINIAIEGMLLGGAFVAAIVGSHRWVRSWAMASPPCSPASLLAWVLAVLAIRYRVDQIIVGVVINIFVLGTHVVPGTADPRRRTSTSTRRDCWPPIKMPLLGDIPFFGPVLFDHNIFVFGMFILVAVTTYALFHTQWGLRSRAVGRAPQGRRHRSASTCTAIRYLNVMLGGAVAGFGGAFFIHGLGGPVRREHDRGRGFIGLAAMIFGRWHPVGALSAALVFGFADSWPAKLAILQTPIPSEFLRHDPLHRHDHRGGRPGGQGPPARRRRPAVRQGVTWSVTPSGNR